MSGDLDFLFQVNFFIVTVCGTVGKKSWTVREHRYEHIPKHLREMH